MNILPEISDNKTGDIMLTIIFRTAIMYFFLIFIMRIMGKRQIGQLQPGELIITMLISEIAAFPMEDSEIPMHHAIIPIAVLALLELTMSFAALKFIRLRSFFQGHSIVVIKNGELDWKQLRRLRYSVDDLLESLREKDVFDISEVQYAIVETDGTLSVLLKPEKRNATVSDVNATPDSKGLPRTLISDGRMIHSQINKSVMTKEEVENLLKKHKLGKKDVLLLTVDENGNINIIEKSKE